MKKMISINGQDVSQIVYRDEPVITLPMIDQLHGKKERADRPANRNFRENRSQFVENEDYFQVPYEEWKQILRGRLMPPQDDLTAHLKDEFDDYEETRGGYRGDMYFLTITGYMLLAKTFRDDLSWEIQRTLVRSYFKNHVPMGDKNRPNPEYTKSLTEQRLSKTAEIKLHQYATKLAKEYIKNGTDPEGLSWAPQLQEAVIQIMKDDPKTKQLKMFEEEQEEGEPEDV